MTKSHLLLILSLVFFSHGAHGESETNDDQAQLESLAKGVVERKCEKCHGKDAEVDPFTEKGSPFFSDPSDAIHRLDQKGDDRMPPKGEPQLTTSQKVILKAWLELLRTSEEPSHRRCRDLKPNPVADAVAIRNLSDSCRECHGKKPAPELFDWPWETAHKLGEDMIRSLHTSFMNENGSLDLEFLGVTSEDQFPPKGHSTLTRLLNQIAEHYMPPRKAPPGFAVSLSDKDRADLVQWLSYKNNLLHCSIVGEPVQLSKNKINYSQVAAWCTALGGWIPTKDQVKEWTSNNDPFKMGACLWTSSYSRQREGQIRLVFELEEDRKTKKTAFQLYRVKENFECLGLCVIEHRREKIKSFDLNSADEKSPRHSGISSKRISPLYPLCLRAR